MRLLPLVPLIGLLAAIAPCVAGAQAVDHVNPMIPLHEKHLPVFGIVHPAITAGRGGGGRGGAAGAPGAAAAAPPPAPVQPNLADVARETLAYTHADYQYASGASDTFLQYVAALKAAGGSARTHAFISKVPIWHVDTVAARQAAIRQLNAGHVGIIMQQVESAAEVRQAIAAIRFASAGGTRPDTGTALAASYWGLTPAQYHQHADVWPLNKAGDLEVWVIVESKEGLAHVNEIAKEPGIAVMLAGYGTLGQVFRGDSAGRAGAAAQILAACKAANVPCGFPTNNPDEITQRMKEGWSVFVMQSRNDAGFAAIETGRKLGGR